MSLAFTAVDRFFRRLSAADETSYIRNAAGDIFFLDMKTEFFTLRIFVAVQDLKISFYMQKFGLVCPPPLSASASHFACSGDGTARQLLVR